MFPRCVLTMAAFSPRVRPSFSTWRIRIRSSGLAPKAGSIERYRLQEWLTFIGTELHKSFGALFNKASSDDAKNTAKTNINKRLTYINDQLANRQYLVGSNFTVADAYAFTIINWTNFVGIDLKAYPNVAAYHGSHCRTPEGARNIEGRRSREVTSRGELR